MTACALERHRYVAVDFNLQNSPLRNYRVSIILSVHERFPK